MTVFNVWPIERVVLFGVYLTSAASFLVRPILPVETKKKKKERKRRFTTLSSLRTKILSSRLVAVSATTYDARKLSDTRLACLY